MVIAEKKKQKNISEYIIFMYQTEDLIRVYDFDIDLIERFVIKHLPLTEAEYAETKNWYQEKLIKMEIEGIKEKGHLKEVQDVVEALSFLSQILLKKDPEYQKTYNKAKIFIGQNLELSKGQVQDEIQICLNGIYGFLLTKMNDEPVPEDLMEPINAFGEVLSYLSFVYKEYEKKG